MVNLSVTLDDGMMELGIEDEQERKDAISRSFGGAQTKSRINFEEDGDNEPERRGARSSKNTRKLKRTLDRLEDKDTWDSDEDRDPYASSQVLFAKHNICSLPMTKKKT